MKGTKKIIFILIGVVVLAALIVGGIFLFNKASKEKREKDFETVAKQYYESYMVGLIGDYDANITLKMIRNVIEEKDEKYDIKSLKKCEDSSTMTFKIVAGKISSQEFDLICK